MKSDLRWIIFLSSAAAGVLVVLAISTQISIARAVWAQGYWLKRMTLAIEIDSPMQSELEEWEYDPEGIPDGQDNCVDFGCQSFIPPAVEP